MADRESPRPAMSPLSVPIFRAVWISSIVSNFGGLIQSVGASWLMIALGASPQLIALVQASTTLPIMLLSLVAGAIADNLDRRKVMLSAQIFMLLVSAALSVFAWAGWLTPWLLLGFTFLIGCGTALNGPAWQASVGDMVPRAALPGAVAMNSMGFNIARSVGPAIGGAIVAAAGAAAAFLANAFSYIGLIAVLARWRPHPIEGRLPPEPIGTAMMAGVRYVAMSPGLRLVLMRALVFGVAASAVPALMPLVARDLVAGGPLTYGLLLGGFGLGAIGGALGTTRLRTRLRPEGVVRAAVLALSAGAVVAALSRTLPITIAGLLFAGAGWVLALSTFNVSVQLSTPRWVVARALALYQMAAFGGMAAGSWLFGIVAEVDGVATSLLVAAALQLVSLVLGFVFALPDIAELDLDLRDWTAPVTSVPILPRSGPIVVTIEYRIAAADLPRFLAAMDERKRIRRRDGARHWTLLRDLMEPELWIERYHVATWLDYVRHNQRRTHADTENSRELLALHQGGGDPIVHRRIERQTRAPTISRGTLDPEIADPLTDPSRSS
ncbi:MFS transporter [Sphingomonas sp.]|uniref:MFS transporter n=1 Tax=Sphingomonas sp. TaxID=28214 RepID=UPI002DBEFCA7|nr:MFS transporter [Sphingomonas sp.]